MNYRIEVKVGKDGDSAKFINNNNEEVDGIMILKEMFEDATIEGLNKIKIEDFKRVSPTIFIFEEIYVGINARGTSKLIQIKKTEAITSSEINEAINSRFKFLANEINDFVNSVGELHKITPLDI